jgi:thiamine monophosphate synthase
MRPSRRPEAVAGAITLLAGLIFLLFLLGDITIFNIPPLFTIGVGVILCVVAISESGAARQAYEILQEPILRTVFYRS